MRTMLAARVHGIKDLRLDTVEMQPIDKGGIRIRVKACSICGSDKRILNIGDFRANYPVIIGHEIAGVVEEVGELEKNFKVGDKVCVAPGYACGKCRNCVKGNPTTCLNPYPSVGYTLNGGFAEYMNVPEHLLRLGFVNKIPEGLSFEEASLAEIIACALHAYDGMKVEAGDHVLILGAGPAGIIHSHLCKMYGATKVTIAQHGKYRLEMAREKFADVVDDTICMAEEDIEETYAERNNGRQPDVVLVCAPSREAQELACRMIAENGRICFFGGLPASDCKITIDANQLHYKEYKITGTSSSKQLNNVTALELLKNKVIDGNKLITASFKLKDIQEAFACAQGKNCIKVVVTP